MEARLRTVAPQGRPDRVRRTRLRLRCASGRLGPSPAVEHGTASEGRDAPFVGCSMRGDGLVLFRRGVAYGTDICFSLRMAVLRAVACAAPLVVVLSGCASSTPTDDSPAMWLINERSAEDDWFCEGAEDGGWDCVQDPQRVANPGTLRLPKPLFALPDTTAQGQDRPYSLGAAPQQPADGAQAEPEDSSAPLYQRLSYRPDRPTPLKDLPGSFYAIQVIALSSKEDLEQFTVDNDLPPMTGAVVETDGKRFYVLFAGIYPDRDTAERAARSLPAEISAHGTWVRSVESLQAAMARAEQIP
ncbi:MAG: hypothetical protein F4169_05760 [Gammaproteobacteria bacterium]|nr:hypothetical protein [Gammaproteobacteria bacterium]